MFALLTQETLLKDLWNLSISLLNYLYVHGSWKKNILGCRSFAEVTFIVPQHFCLSSCLNNSTDNDGPCYQTGIQPNWLMIFCIFFKKNKPLCYSQISKVCIFSSEDLQRIHLGGVWFKLNTIGLFNLLVYLRIFNFILFHSVVLPI